MMDDVAALPTESFVYDHPVMLDCPFEEKNGLITTDMLKKLGDELYEADLIIFNTNSGRSVRWTLPTTGSDFAAVGAECAEWCA